MGLTEQSAFLYGHWGVITSASGRRGCATQLKRSVISRQLMPNSCTGIAAKREGTHVTACTTLTLYISTEMR